MKQLSKENEIVVIKIEMDKAQVLSQIDNLLITALESYSGYWARMTKAGNPKVVDGYYYVGRDVTITENEASGKDGKKSQTLTVDKLLEGFILMANKQPKHFADVIADNHDAETADVFLQYCVLGDLIYG